MEVIPMDKDIKQYIEPSIVDYGSIAEMTAGQSFRFSDDFAKPGNVLLSTTGACNPDIKPGLCTP
jgi:hypothetical protein